jgi:hypothetical protein
MMAMAVTAVTTVITKKTGKENNCKSISLKHSPNSFFYFRVINTSCNVDNEAEILQSITKDIMKN